MTPALFSHADLMIVVISSKLLATYDEKSAALIIISCELIIGHARKPYNKQTTSAFDGTTLACEIEYLDIASLRHKTCRTGLLVDSLADLEAAGGTICRRSTMTPFLSKPDFFCRLYNRADDEIWTGV